MWKHRLKTFTALHRIQEVAFDEWQPGDVIILCTIPKIHRKVHTCIFITPDIIQSTGKDHACFDGTIRKWQGKFLWTEVLLLCTACSGWDQNDQFANKWLLSLSWHDTVCPLQTLSYKNWRRLTAMSFVTYPLPKRRPTQLDRAVSKDMFPFYKLLEKPMFMSFGGGSGHKMGRTKCFMFKIKMEKYTPQSERCGHLWAETLNVLWMKEFVLITYPLS